MIYVSEKGSRYISIGIVYLEDPVDTTCLVGLRYLKADRGIDYGKSIFVDSKVCS